MIKEIKEIHQLNDSQFTKLEQYLSERKVGEKIYPSVLKTCLSIDIDTAYRMLEDLKEKGYLKLCFRMECKNCRKEFFFESMKEFEYECKYCGHPTTLDDIIVLYEVIR